MLADDAALEDVAVQNGGLLQSLPKGGIHICAGTHGIAVIRKLKAAHAEAGQILVAAPMLGRPELVAVRPGRHRCIGGPTAMADRCKPLFDAIGRRTFEAGADPAAAAAIKIANNFVLGCAIEAMGEGFSLVRKYGVAPQVFYDVMTDGLFDCSAYKVYGKIIVDESYCQGRPDGRAGPEGRQPRAGRRRGRRRAAAERQRLARPAGRRHRPRRRRQGLGGDGARAGARQRTGMSGKLSYRCSERRTTEASGLTHVCLGSVTDIRRMG